MSTIPRNQEQLEALDDAWNREYTKKNLSGLIELVKDVEAKACHVISVIEERENTEGPQDEEGNFYYEKAAERLSDLRNSLYYLLRFHADKTQRGYGYDLPRIDEDTMGPSTSAKPENIFEEGILHVAFRSLSCTPFEAMLLFLADMTSSDAGLFFDQLRTQLTADPNLSNSPLHQCYKDITSFTHGNASSFVSRKTGPFAFDTIEYYRRGQILNFLTVLEAFCGKAKAYLRMRDELYAQWTDCSIDGGQYYSSHGRDYSEKTTEKLVREMARILVNLTKEEEDEDNQELRKVERESVAQVLSDRVGLAFALEENSSALPTHQSAAEGQ